MEVVGRRSSASNHYNPLNDNNVDNVGDLNDQVWVCVAAGGAVYYSSPTVMSVGKKTCIFATCVKGRKDGEWLRDSSNGMYLPISGEDGCRNFKNERLLLMERSQVHFNGPVKRTTSNSSSEWESGLMKRLSSSAPGFKSRSDSYTGDITRRTSFRWVDSEGVSRRISGDDDALRDVEERPEVWVCAKNAGVQYRTAPIHDACTDKVCAYGQKVTAIKEGSWLKIMEVKETFDLVVAAEAIGRRSFQTPTRVTTSFTGLWLPYTLDNENTRDRLFKNEKLAYFEATQAEGMKIAHTQLIKQQGECTVM